MSITIEVPAVEAEEILAIIDGRVERTPAAREASEGDTMRAELAAGICQATWRNYPHVNIREDPTRYRQHRCGRDHEHRGACRCRYCGSDRSSA